PAVAVNPAKAKSSINKGLGGTSVGGQETLTSNPYLPDESWPTPISTTGTEQVTIDFVKGEPDASNGEAMTAVEVIQKLQDVAQPYGVGRDIHVGDTIIGIKGRVGFEAAGPIIIVKAHHTLEKHVLTKWQLSWKDQLGAFYGNFLHE